ncbi:MAG: peptide deformylase [Acidobacteria bacterium]|nr:peptide deformylase [Acidobacteriota bacterium]MBU4306816.1 peptide deformylase [Acidobacteriota bacterium]MCG2811828.1 peptide deformylase [Candidatus Aminicenantes bacterium]
MAVKEILRLGNPGLWKVCETIKSPDSAETRQIILDLKDTLEDFKEKNSFGRAIAAPQIGVLKRIIFIDFPKEIISRLMINPKIVWRSLEKIQLWDDCFSFPDLLVKVERAKEIKVEYLSSDGENCSVSAKGDLSELLQHEIDHLDGILAVQRAIDGKSFAFRNEWEKFWKN